VIRRAALLTLLAFALTPAAARADANDPVLQWHLDDVAHTGAPDSSGNGRDGSFVSDKKAVADGRFGGAMASGLNGNSERVLRSADAAMKSQAFTAMTWIRATSYPGNGEIMGLGPINCNTPIWSFKNQGGDLVVAAQNTTTSTIAGGDVYDGRWHLLAATVSNGVLRTYLDGGLVKNDGADGAGSINYGATALDLVVGGDECADVTSPVNFDDVRYYGRVLTVGEIGFLSRSRFSEPGELPVPANDPGWENLVGQWHLNATTAAGAVADSSPSGNAGTKNGTFVAGKWGNGLLHQGTSNGLTVPSSAALEPTRDLTVMAWVKGTSATANRVVLSKGAWLTCADASYDFDTYQGGIRFEVNTIPGGLQQTDPIASASIWNGQWHAVAGSYDASRLKLYLDGNLVSNKPAAAENIDYGSTTQSTDLRTGNSAGNCANTAWTGTIDEVRVYNRALFDDEIQYLQTGSPAVPPDLPTPARAPEPGPVGIDKPQLTGNPSTGGTGHLTCGTGTWTGHPTSFTYTWERGARAATADGDASWTAIPGATGNTYAPTSADDAARVRCHVYAANFKGTGDNVSTGIRTDPGIPGILSAPQVVGVVAAGNQVRCDTGQWTNNPSFKVVWLRDGEPLTYATSTEYTIQGSYHGSTLFDPNGDGQHKISCRVTADNDVGVASSVDSAQWLALDNVPVSLSDAARLLLDLKRTNNVGRGATCYAGDWLSDQAAAGEAGGHYEYQWLRNGQVIPGQTGSRYTLIADDLGTTLECKARAVNVLGEGGWVTSNDVDIDLPQKTSEDASFTALYRDNRYDPINLMVIGRSYLNVLNQVIVEQLQRKVTAEIAACKTLGGIPGAPTVVKPPKFPLTREVRCSILLKDPTGYVISAQGVKWTRGLCQPRAGQLRDQCNDMGFTLPPLDPAKAASFDPDLEAQLAPNTPLRVVWDIDGDGKTDITCPGTAPVVRGLVDQGTYTARGIIVYADTATTGRMASATKEFAFPDSTQTTRVKLRKPNQPLWCRTSIVPPPDPETAPCTGHGAIGNVQIEGNLCPINLRATPNEAFDDLDSDVTEVLDAAATALANAEKDADNPGKQRRSTKLLADEIAPPVAVDPLKPETFLPPALQKRVTATTLTGGNLASAVTGAYSLQNGGDQSLSSFNLVDRTKPDIAHFDLPKAQFATDQIYTAVGDLKINGVTVQPEPVKVNEKDPPKLLPTLIVPSDSGEAIPSVADVKRMTINAKNVATKMAIQKVKDGVKQQVDDLPLSPAEPLNQLVKDLPSSPEQVLRDKIDLDALDLNLGPFNLVGKYADIKLAPNGTAVIHAQAELPIIQGSDGKGLRTDVTLAGDLDGNVKLQGVQLAQHDGSVAFMFGLQLKGLFLSYSPDGGLEVKGQIVFPASGQGIDIEDFKLGSDGGFRALDVDYVTGIGQGIPIGPGVFLTKLGGGLYNDDSKHYTAVKAGGAVSAIAPGAGGGCPTVGTDGKLDVQFRPEFYAEIRGDVNVVCIPIGGAFLGVYPERGDLTLKMHWGLDLNVARFQAELAGNIHVDPNMWQLEYHMGVKFPFLDNPITGVPSADADGVLSNKGAAICAHVGPFDVGAGEHFSGGRPPLTYIEFLKNIKPFFAGCNRSEFASEPLTTAQAGGAKAFQLDGSYVTLAIDGAGAPPKVQLKSPSGKVYDFTGDKASITGDALGVPLPDDARTVVILKKPEKGRWTVTPAEGSAPIVRILHASQLPEAKVTGKVTGRGQNRTLAYNVRPLKGQVVNFVEESKGGHRIVKTVKTGGKGRVNYVVAESASTTRELTAEVIQNDTPRTNIVIARYSAANPKVGKPKVKIKRRGSKALVTWTSAPLAVRYYVTVTEADGSRYTLAPKKRTVTIKRVGKKDAIAVSVQGVSAGGRKGPAGKATLKRQSHPRRRK
jgi:hypothetical protein